MTKEYFTAAQAREISEPSAKERAYDVCEQIRALLGRDTSARSIHLTCDFWTNATTNKYVEAFRKLQNLGYTVIHHSQSDPYRATSTEISW